MKTLDGRFIEKRVKISKRLINIIVKNIKTKNNLTWKELSKMLGMSVQTVRVDWLKKGNTLPESIFKRLLSLDKTLQKDKILKEILFLNPSWGQEKGGNASRNNKSIKLPDKKSVDFAEFYGIMLGDGCIYSNISGFCISGDSISDKKYYEDYLKKLIFKLFGIEPNLCYSNHVNSVRCSFYSRKLSRFLMRIGFPKGKKRLGKLEIPNFILKDFNLIKACLRGLNDTDGTVCAHPNSRIMIQISITVPSLLDSCKRAFDKLGIKVGAYNKGINIYGQDKINQYFEIIGSSNPKHLIKYKKFLETGKVPSKQETESFLIKKNLQELGSSSIG